MKKTNLIIFILLLTTSIIYGASSLNFNASQIKTNYPIQYENTIKRNASENWGSDYSMVLYEINKQSDDLMGLVKKFESQYTGIVRNAIIDWSIDGYANKNSNLLNALSVFNLEGLIALNCDWSMVEYEYDKQVKANSAIEGTSLEGLKSNAIHISSLYPTQYKNTLKKHAMENWSSDYSMVVYEINKQSDSLITLINDYKTDYYSIVIDAILRWSIDGYENFNIEELRTLSVFNLEGLIELHCDWSMVKYEYNKQVKAKNSF